METIKSANLLLRFLLELCLLAALGYWGFKIGSGLPLKIALGIGAPLLAAIVWATFVAPKSSLQLQEPLLLMLELIIFGLTSAALYAAERPALAWALSLGYVINRILMYVWEQ